MDKKQRKELAKAYTEAKVIGGVFIIKNTQNGKVLLDSTAELQGTKNRFAFSNTIGDCFTIKLKEDWKAMGGDAFVLEILEELEKKPEQTLQEFREDLKVLKKMWEEKFTPEQLY